MSSEIEHCTLLAEKIGAVGAVLASWDIFSCRSGNRSWAGLCMALIVFDTQMKLNPKITECDLFSQ